MTVIRINEKICRVPSSWQEFTVRMMQDTIKNHKENPELWKNMLYRLSVYSGFDFDELVNAKISDEQYQFISQLLEFEREALDVASLVVPNAIKFYKEKDGSLNVFTTIRVPKNIDEEAVGKKVFFKDDVILYWHEHKDIVPVLHKALAIYFQSEVMPSGKPNTPMNSGLIRDFEEVCLDCLFVEAFPVANFFLKKSISWMLKSRRN